MGDWGHAKKGRKRQLRFGRRPGRKREGRESAGPPRVPGTD